MNTPTGQAVGLAVEQPVVTGRHARRRVLLAPSEPPAPGAELRLTVEPEALQDSFLNLPRESFNLTFTWPAGDAVLFDDVAPRVTAVVLRDNHLEVEFSEEPDLAAASQAVQLGGTGLTWTLCGGRYRLCAAAELPQGQHALAIDTAALDLAGRGLTQAFGLTVEVTPEPASRLLFEEPDPNQIASSALGNRHGFHGRPVDPETGLIYFRNRYYHPELGRFISQDPLGYVDGPSLYQHTLNNPINFRDPMGLRAATEQDREFLRRLSRLEAELRREYEASGSFRGQVLTPAEYEHALLDVRSMQKSYIEAVAAAYEGEDIGRDPRPISFFDRRAIQVYHPVPSYERWERQTRENMRILVYTIEGPNLVVSLLAPYAAVKMIRQNARGADLLAKEMEAGVKQAGGSKGPAERVPTGVRFTRADFPEVAPRVSQKQLRHIAGRPEHTARGGGFLNSLEEAQAVLDAYRAGRATILGRTQQGFPVVRFEGVTGTNVNPGAGFPSQPTNVFMIKGTSSPSVVPMSPRWTPR